MIALVIDVATEIVHASNYAIHVRQKIENRQFVFWLWRT